MSPGRFYVFLCLFAAFCLIAATAPASLAVAQGGLAGDLISTINALRASQGLAPYTVDAQLMAMAQQHSSYQASIRTSTHLHSNGLNPPKLGIVENVAGGTVGGLTAQIIVYEIWADPVHMKTMTGYPTGTMGVGVADDGEFDYVTLEVRPAGASTGSSGSSGATNNPTPFTPIPVVPLATMTPRPDGNIFHEVGYGQTLWAIALAYGVTVDQLRAWNNLPADSNEIYAGQMLLVRPASLAPPTPVATETAVATALEVALAAATRESPTAAQVIAAKTTVTSTATPERSEKSIPASQDEAGGRAWLPLIAVVSLLAGGVLLFLFVRRKPGNS
jgi:hypothetical protein